jgi:Predicted transcriptional regulators
MVQITHSDRPSEGADAEQASPAESQKSGKGSRRGRIFDYGELRLLLLGMLAERSSHGYELINEIKERFGGMYKPSPGVIYPTLTWLYDRNYAVIDLEKGGRKRYSITDEGRGFLAANQAVSKMLMARVAPADNRKSPEQLVGAMDHLKRALSLRIKLGSVADGVVDQMAEVIHAAADKLEALLAAPPLADVASTSIAEIATPNASRYLRRLCSHFHHRTPVVSDETAGQFKMSMGEVRMEVVGDAIFKVTLTSPSAKKLPEMEEIIVRHLLETAVREELDVQWQRTTRKE